MNHFDNGPSSEIVGYRKKERGCHVPVFKGFILTCLTLILAVVVGLVVHLVENREIKCVFPEDQNNAKGSSQEQSGSQEGTGRHTPIPTTPSMIIETTPGTQSTSQPKPKDLRLPWHVNPEMYRLTLEPHIYSTNTDDFFFNGDVEIDILCNEPSANVTLHANTLNITAVQFNPRLPTTGGPGYHSHELDQSRQFLVVRLDGEMVKNERYTLKITYSGPLKNDLTGLYLSSYQRGNNTVYMVTSQLEPTDARKVFPCLDEPQFKSHFQVTLVRRSDLKMSTYLMAFIICDFENRIKITEHGIQYGAWAQEKYIDQVDLALDIGTKVITNYEKYFDIRFPLPKQDMIAIPDFAAGAMENWGLITYRETAMLFEQRVAAEKNKQRVAVVIAHELAHQWFGDLVTMDWWGDVWLNEGLATLIEYQGTGMVFHDWDMDAQFVIDEVHVALDFDGLVSSHPIYTQVSTPDEINELFDKINYNKGGSVLRMLRFVLGEETFRKGVVRYLQSRKYQNANHDQLWDSIEQELKNESVYLDINIKSLMDTWILQMNYPVVTLHRQGKTLSITQKRFLRNPDANDPLKYTSPFGYTWKIPITYTTSNEVDFNKTGSDVKWLTTTTMDHTDNSFPDGNQENFWIIGNIQEFGFYRVNYDEANWNALIKQLKTKHEVIHPKNRAQIINDAWSLSKAQQLKMDIALQTVEYLDKELNYIPWKAAVVQLNYLDQILQRTDLYGDFIKFMKLKIKDPFNHYAMDDTNATHIESYMRSMVSSLACSYGIDECNRVSKRLFKQWMDNPSNNPIDPDMRETVYCSAISQGDQEEWDFGYQQFKLATSAAEKETITKSLACTRSTWLLNRYLNIAISEIRKQDTVHVLTYIASNPTGRSLAWDFTRSKWDYLSKEYGAGFLLLTNIINGVTDSFSTEFELQQLKRFVDEHPNLGTGTRAFKQAIEKTESNILFVKKYESTIRTWLKSAKSSSEHLTDVRLPRHVYPLSYDIELKPNMYEGDEKNFTFDGFVRIHIQCRDAESSVTLHSNKLSIDESSIQFIWESGTGRGPKYISLNYDEERQFLIIQLDSSMIEGENYSLQMNFTGALDGSLAGFYLSKNNRGNETIYIATSQMEPTDARKTLPCFDEPDIKSYFNVILVRKRNLKSLSNMPIKITESRGDDFEADIFERTAKMSTYLLAFIVGDFVYKSNTTSKNITYRVWSPPESINQTEKALDYGTRIITHYANYYGIDFPLPKQDMIAIPDFEADAMENWGLITYRETAMLYEPGVASESDLQRVAVVVAHELAHQWFGDLVTMDWWDDLWLNEGFASYVEYMGTDFVEPSWKMFEQFVTETLHTAFEFDALVTSHPLFGVVQNPDELYEIFDGISYNKGASMIQMAQFFLGETTFQKGLQRYLRNRAFQNANHNDLWNALEEVKNESNHQTVEEATVKDILDTWTLQMNYPVVMLSISGNGTTLLSQKRLLSNKFAKDPMKYISPFNYTWKIPFTMTTSDNTNFNQSKFDVMWLTSEEQVFPNKYPTSNGSWVIGNVMVKGYYRVNYQENNWNALIRQLNQEYRKIYVSNRAQLINDAMELAKAGELSMELALNIFQYLDKEREYTPWVAAKVQLSYIDDMIVRTELYGAFEKFIKSKVAGIFNELGLNDTGASHIESYLRSSIANSACYYGIEDCVQNATAQYREWMTNPNINSIDADLKSTIYCTAVREGGADEWDFALAQYRKSPVAAEKSNLLSAMACTREVWILSKYLDMTLEGTDIKTQDATSVIVGVAANPVGTLLAWDFFREKIEDILNKFGPESFSLITMIKGLTSTFNTNFQLQQLEEFKDQHPDLGSGTRALQQAIETTEANINWMKVNYDIVAKWLQSQTV
ncbi:hypothetical protein ACJMK2_025576 [Sinanodonta woodiana]|uniref:Aminopeptidase N n=1 Tax=Sinanodonta woodiana TaxID=1069815 RepID=A0ABD3XGY6_SINWO